MPLCNGAVNRPTRWVNPALDVTFSHEPMESKADNTASLEPMCIEHAAIVEPEAAVAQVRRQSRNLVGFEAHHLRYALFVCSDYTGRDQKAGNVQKFWLGETATFHGSYSVPDPFCNVLVVLQRSGRGLCESGT